MRQLWKNILILTLFLGCFAEVQATILPLNELHHQDHLNSGTGISEKEFHSILDRMDELYAPIIRRFGAILKINRHWESHTVNATASQALFIWKVDMFGGFARRPEMTPDGFTLAVCHELGHHLAGYPFSYYSQSNEGQADYFAVLSCARVVWGEELEANAQFRATVPPVPKALCDNHWDREDEQNLCYRAMLASEPLALLFAALGQTDVAWDTPDPGTVSRTDDNHPRAQCRLDTYMAAAVCRAQFSRDKIPGKRVLGVNNEWAEEQSAMETCLTAKQYAAGFRPGCWFKSIMVNAR